MIRSRIGTDPEVLRHHPPAQRVAGAECRDPILAPLQLGGELFSLDIPSHRTSGWAEMFGSPLGTVSRAVESPLEKLKGFERF